MTRTSGIGQAGVRAAVPQADAGKRVEPLRRRARHTDDDADEDQDRRGAPPPGMGKLVDRLV